MGRGTGPPNSEMSSHEQGWITERGEGFSRALSTRKEGHWASKIMWAFSPQPYNESWKISRLPHADTRVVHANSIVSEPNVWENFNSFMCGKTLIVPPHCTKGPNPLSLVLKSTLSIFNSNTKVHYNILCFICAYMCICVLICVCVCVYSIVFSFPGLGFKFPKAETISSFIYLSLENVIRCPEDPQ